MGGLGNIIEMRPYLKGCVQDMIAAGERHGARWVTAGKRLGPEQACREWRARGRPENCTESVLYGADFRLHAFSLVAGGVSFGGLQLLKLGLHGGIVFRQALD